jgi:hypothetical protein
MGLLDWLFRSRDISTDEPIPEPVHLAPGRSFAFEVVGEANYQDALDEICGGKCEDGHNLPARAQLIFQEDNPYDPNAIAVLIDRWLVGYVPRDLAAGMRSAILTLNPEERPVTCDALVVGGWMRDEGEDEGHYGVKLSLAHPLRVRAAG